MDCSARRRVCRDRLRELAPDVVFVHLMVDPALVAERLSDREHEFLPATLLAPFATLEVPTDDERHVDVDPRKPVEQIAADVVALWG